MVLLKSACLSGCQRDFGTLGWLDLDTRTIHISAEAPITTVVIVVEESSRPTRGMDVFVVHPFLRLVMIYLRLGSGVRDTRISTTAVVLHCCNTSTGKTHCMKGRAVLESGTSSAL